MKLNLWGAATLFIKCAVIVVFIAGCGGSEEPKITIYLSFFSDPFPHENASIEEETKLKALGVRTENKRCAKNSSMHGGELVLFVDGIIPRYVLFDIPESQFALAHTLRYIKFVDDGALQAPFWPCATEGL